MLGLIKLSPVFLLSGLMIGNNIYDLGLDILVIGPIVTIYAAIIAYITEKLSFNDILNSAIKNVSNMQLVFFILMFAYAMAEVFMSTGVGAAIINMSLKLGLTARTIGVTTFLVTSLLSIATGTSWGTFAATAPIFLWLNHMVGGDILITLGALAGGACFGDNIGLISETTVISSGIQGVEVIHRIRHQGVWSVLCLLTAAVLFVLFSLGLSSVPGDATNAIGQIPADVWDNLTIESPSAISLLNQVQSGVSPFMIIPLVLVLIAAFKGLPTLVCLGIGILSSLLFGLMAGTVESLMGFLDLIYNGFSEAGSWVIIMMMWMGAFGGIMGKIHAFEPLSKLVIKLVRNVRQLMFANGILSLIGNAALSDEMAQIVTIGPIIKELTEENIEASKEDMYTLALRNATFSDALAVFGSQFIPWHVYVVYFVGIANTVYPLYDFVATDIIRYNFMAIVAVVSILLLTLTGLDRYIPLFRMPSEPDVKLKKRI